MGIAKAASVFVLYATSCANNVAQKSHRKTLTGADVIKAIHEMEFDKFVKPLEASLGSWKASQAKKKEESSKRKKAKEELNKRTERRRSERTRRIRVTTSDIYQPLTDSINLS